MGVSRRIRRIGAIGVTAAFVALFWFTDWFGPGVGTNLTFTVNSTADAGDNNPGNGVCSTGGTISGGAAQCTLRAAIEEANAVAGLDTINFSIPTTDANHASGVWTIAPASGNPLPEIYSPVTIDGTTQSGVSVNTAQSPSNMTGNLAVQISGVNDTTTADWDGLVLNTGSDGSTVRGLSIYAFDNSASEGILIWNSSNNVIAGNHIGVRATGTVGNDGNNAGVGIAGGSSNNRIGGAAAADRNMCSVNSASGNEWACIWAFGTTTRNNTVEGNELGLMKNGTATGAGWAGIDAWEGTTMTVGGTSTGAGNRITGFSKGITLNDVTPAPHIAIVGNRIWGNSFLAIDFKDDNVTSNDVNDADSGPNDLLNFPVISSVKAASTTVTISYSLDVPAGSYYIEAFTNPSGADPSGYGEAQVTAGSSTITKTGSGSQSFTMTYTGAVGDIVSMTATQLSSGTPYQTSELSQTATAVNRLATVNSTAIIDDSNAGDGVCSTGGTNSAGATACTLLAAVTEANASAAIDTIWFNIPTSDPGYSAGVWTIAPPGGTAPAVSTTMTIDATTQPGWSSTPVVSYNAAGLSSGPAVSITASGVVVKGLNVRGSPGVGISVAGSGSTVAYCFVGTNAAGTAASPNAAQGVTVSAANVTLDHNLISGNGFDGVIISSSGTVVTDNVIGTTVTGNAALPNGQEGIELSNATNTVIGTVGHGNVISGNLYAGINGWSGTNTGVKVQANKIGVGADGATAVANGTANAEGGITLRGTNTGWLIGGSGAGEGNTIADNSGDGVMLITVNGSSNDIAVIGNSIHSNTGLAIDLGDDGVTANDTGDGDSGLNDLLNYPVIGEVGLSGGNLTVTYRLDAPAGTYRVEFFTNSAADPTGYGEAQTLAGSASVTHTGGTATYTASFAGAANATITASVTENPSANTWGATSELSLAVTAGVTVSGTVYEDVDGDGLISDDGAARSAVDVWLFAEKDGNSKPSGGDVLVDTAATDGSGAYNLVGPAGATVYVVVDSRDVTPSSGFAGGFSAGSAWAEQTYGPAGSATYNGTTWSYAASAGTLFGGARPASSDGFPALTDSDHIARLVLSTSGVSGLDWGFSFVPVVRTYDTVPASGFTSAGSWSTYDPGANGVGTDPDGFYGAVFDGRYIYFVPHNNGTSYHGEVLRYDTRATFASTAAWASYDPGSHGVGTDPDGFYGAVFDGRYIYFVPHNNGISYHGEVLRYDTRATFASTAAWRSMTREATGWAPTPTASTAPCSMAATSTSSPQQRHGGRRGGAPLRHHRVVHHRLLVDDLRRRGQRSGHRPRRLRRSGVRRTVRLLRAVRQRNLQARRGAPLRHHRIVHHRLLVDDLRRRGQRGGHRPRRIQQRRVRRPLHLFRAVRQRNLQARRGAPLRHDGQLHVRRIVGHVRRRGQRGGHRSRRVPGRRVRRPLHLLRPAQQRDGQRRRDGALRHHRRLRVGVIMGIVRPGEQRGGDRPRRLRRRGVRRPLHLPGPAAQRGGLCRGDAALRHHGQLHHGQLVDVVRSRRQRSGHRSGRVPGDGVRRPLHLLRS
ncbi:MAG: right-handed parallel beta-helix repeat-containing protein [Acidimicrobiales bacterium]